MSEQETPDQETPEEKLARLFGGAVQMDQLEGFVKEQRRKFASAKQNQSPHAIAQAVANLCKAEDVTGPGTSLPGITHGQLHEMHLSSAVTWASGYLAGVKPGTPTMNVRVREVARFFETGKLTEDASDPTIGLMIAPWLEPAEWQKAVEDARRAGPPGVLRENIPEPYQPAA